MKLFSGTNYALHCAYILMRDSRNLRSLNLHIFLPGKSTLVLAHVCGALVKLQLIANLI